MNPTSGPHGGPDPAGLFVVRSGGAQRPPLPGAPGLLTDAYRLTERAAEVVGLVVRGHSNAEIARASWSSTCTVADHVENVFEKTGVRSRGELTSRLFSDHYLPRL